MAGYTYEDIIMDPEDPRLEGAIGKVCYFGDYPIGVLDNARNDLPESLFRLKSIDKKSVYPFLPDGYEAEWALIIIKKEEPKPKYVPFESVEEFVERYMEVKRGVKSNSFEDNLLQCGMGLKERGREYDVFCLVTELWDYGVVIGEEKMVIRENSVHNNTTSWRELYDKYVFIDGSPCGKEVKDE